MKAYGYDYNIISNWLQYYLAPPHPAWSDLPLRPSMPTYPAQYYGLRIRPKGITTEDMHYANISGEYGGWGQLTMGLLAPAPFKTHPYGLVGLHDQWNTAAGDIGAEASFVEDAASMEEATATPHYIIVSVWPNNWFTREQTDRLTGVQHLLELEFGAYKWDNLYERWAAPIPPRPAAPPLDFAPNFASHLRYALASSLAIISIQISF